MLLAKPDLPQDVIDTSVGEPYVVRDFLTQAFDLSLQEIPVNTSIFEYPSPNGYKPLVDFLEEKYGAPVVITNGAKQALGASLYALKKMGKKKIGMRTPYWALLPQLIDMHGLQMHPSFNGADANLLLIPNNPDGFVLSPDALKEFSLNCQEKNIPLVHDAAYYTHVYLPNSYPLDPIGDLQIFSISKMLGLSGLRLGYVVCHNRSYYKYLQEYMEAMTVGVSNISQSFLYDLFIKMNESPALSEEFETQSFLSIKKSKKIIKQVDSRIIEVPDKMEKIPGMFGWFKIGPNADFKKSKVNVIDGAPFGVPGFIRMNLALPCDKVQEIVNRLNSVL